MKVYRVKLHTGPFEVQERAEFARDEVLQVIEGTESIYLDICAVDPHWALRNAARAAGFSDVRPDLGDAVLFEHE